MLRKKNKWKKIQLNNRKKLNQAKSLTPVKNPMAPSFFNNSSLGQATLPYDSFRFVEIHKSCTIGRPPQYPKKK